MTDSAPWSSGQDASLSRWKQEFDSPWGHHITPDFDKKSGVFIFVENCAIAVFYSNNMTQNTKNVIEKTIYILRTYG